MSAISDEFAKLSDMIESAIGDHGDELDELTTTVQKLQTMVDSEFKSVWEAIDKLTPKGFGDNPFGHGEFGE